jgi:hypothetical protein
MGQRRRQWLLLAPVHGVTYGCVWFLVHYLFVETRPLAVPAVYAFGSVVAIGVLAAVAPLAISLLGVFTRPAPRTAWVCVLGLVSGCLGVAVLYLWPEQLLQQYSGAIVMLVQNSVATFAAIGVYVLFDNWRSRLTIGGGGP